MAEIQVPLGAETASATVSIDGITYRPLLVDTSGRLYIAVALKGTAPPDTVANGQHTVASAGTAEQFPDVSCVGASIKALADNTDDVYVGDSDVSASNGRELEPGEVLDLAISNLNVLYLDAAVNGEGVSYLALS